MPRRPEGRTTVICHAYVDAELNRAAQAYADRRMMSRSTVYAQALAWYLDAPWAQEGKEALTDADLRAMERWSR